ncbi:7,8-didemethyl-8-hydroxy-5-deazariboflavin synthase CofG [Microbacterium rhizosphaerae]|uniref:7,8-didemethyl-8-hydroxy-5-deazariboflavin synthase n=2 Tax=Microbacterium rhizosphaerae TaxID=1678237 RepID=A0ABZ0SPS8_9MICO|nr:7,8-didemethyl-8-hydroxy-5-deazariboflavin synthase CofG [Microbacterium rhizosphaerae]WPR90306.1 7,8-didemethyl-8-hydroxy-5-deazariboflavin synthase CofG [Microbacterium rhizosphaerae]
MTLFADMDRIDSDIETVLDAAARGERVEADEAEILLHARGDRLERLLVIASQTRDAGAAASGRPDVITYSRKVFIPLTTLCRDRCHYCIFVDTPGQLRTLHKPVYMTSEQVLSVARQGAALGCKEALLTLGDRPEERWPEARAWLDEHGYASTLDYVGAMARLITAETGLLAHLNPGVMSHDELVALRPTAPSMGMMLETTSRRLFEEPGQVHYGSPDKDPAVRLAVIEDAGRARIPFTTGVLIGIGETAHDRAESLVAIRDAHQRHGHVQEVIVQNFRAKDHTAMRAAADAETLEYVAAVAVARVVMGPDMRIQVPPNLSDPTELELLVRAGADDWGGVSPLTADHVNPERPWPHLDDLAARTAELGFELRERLTAQPPYVVSAEEWIDEGLRPQVLSLAAPDGLAAVTPAAASPAASANPHPMPEPSSDSRTIDVGSGMKRGLAAKALIERAAASPASLDDAEWGSLLLAAGEDLDALAATADDVRRYTVGEAVTLVVNRNLTSTGFRAALGSDPDPATFTLDDVTAIAMDAAALGATELCVQGRLPASEDPSAYVEIVRAARAADPALHLHAYRPQDVWDLADRGGLGLDAALGALRDAGVNTVPGTGVKVLSERVRRLVAPGDLEIDRWIEGITAAHRAGFRSTSVLFYGHVETAAERIAHLRELLRIQADTRGFAEFVPIPLPRPDGGVPLVPGRSPLDEHRAMVAVARLMLSGSIPHIQIPWTRLGLDASGVLLRSGGDDLGGVLLDGRVKPAAGIEHGLELPVKDAAALAARMFRPFRLRTTDYRWVAR